jgi:hypothetical protein
MYKAATAPANDERAAPQSSLATTGTRHRTHLAKLYTGELSIHA